MSLIQPHGNELVNLYKNNTPDTDYTIKVNESLETDIYNLGVGIYSPLKGFMKKNELTSVIENMELEDGTLWPIPLLLDISEDDKDKIKEINAKYILIKNKNEEPIAIIKNEEIFQYDKKKIAEKVFKTKDKEHPGVNYIYNMNEYFIGGEIITLKENPLKEEKQIGQYYKTPQELREIFENKGWSKIVAFQTRNAPHRSHEYLQKCALQNCDGLFINPVIGKKKKGDLKDDYIIGSYETLIENYYNKEYTYLGILPLTMKYAGPREAILHAIIRQNFGYSHMIVGRDHAGVKDYYGSYEAQEIFNNISKERLKINILKYENAAYCNKCEEVSSNKSCPHDAEEKIFISGTELREKIKNKEHIPKEFMRKEVLDFILSGKNQFVEK